MSLLENVVAGVLKNSLGSQAKSNNDALGGLLGQVVASQLGGKSQQQSGLGGLLGQVVASQLGGSQPQQSGLGGMLGSLLGGQSRQSVPASDLGSILGQVIGSQRQQGGFNKNTLLIALLPVVLTYIQSNGGLSGVLAKVQNSGLGNKAQSWVGLDANNGLDAQDVLGLFGQDEINKVCQVTGATQNDVCQGIAELLPQVVNDLTPNGDLSSESEANNEISQILKQFQG